MSLNLPVLKSYSAPTSTVIYDSGTIIPSPSIPLYQTNGSVSSPPPSSIFTVTQYSAVLSQLSNGLYSWKISVAVSAYSPTDVQNFAGASYTSILPLENYIPTVDFGNTFSVGITSAVVPITYNSVFQYLYGGNVDFAITLNSPFVSTEITDGIAPSPTPPSIVANFNIVPVSFAAGQTISAIIASIDYIVYGVPY